jgi:hypothetical protein
LGKDLFKSVPKGPAYPSFFKFCRFGKDVLRIELLMEGISFLEADDGTVGASIRDVVRVLIWRQPLAWTAESLTTGPDLKVLVLSPSGVLGRGNSTPDLPESCTETGGLGATKSVIDKRDWRSDCCERRLKGT